MQDIISQFVDCAELFENIFKFVSSRIIPLLNIGNAVDVALCGVDPKSWKNRLCKRRRKPG